MKNIFKYSEFINESSSLSKLGLPKETISTIHNNLFKNKHSNYNPINNNHVPAHDSDVKMFDTVDDFFEKFMDNYNGKYPFNVYILDNDLKIMNIMSAGRDTSHNSEKKYYLSREDSVNEYFEEHINANKILVVVLNNSKVKISKSKPKSTYQNQEIVDIIFNYIKKNSSNLYNSGFFDKVVGYEDKNQAELGKSILNLMNQYFKGDTRAEYKTEEIMEILNLNRLSVEEFIEESIPEAINFYIKNRLWFKKETIQELLNEVGVDQLVHDFLYRFMKNPQKFIKEF